ncbi:hypothetical protein PybrP1_000755 [[Pythium] brassicae (nom. inval.)]|nr:hypothetical protein PybrP1_000755 [[Pythium] brassicae (nom. inval.)]
MTTRASDILAFIRQSGHFQWLSMPQGLKNAPQVYQRMLDNALFGFVRPQGEWVRHYSAETGENRPATAGSGAFGIDEAQSAIGDTDLARAESNRPAVAEPGTTRPKEDIFRIGEVGDMMVKPVFLRRSYIDDIAFGARTWDECCEMAKRFLDRMIECGISLSLPKSQFGQRKIEFLSRYVSVEGLEAKPKDLSGLKALEFPTTKRGLQSFLGTINYYKFMQDFSFSESEFLDLTKVAKAKRAFEVLETVVCKVLCFDTSTVGCRQKSPCTRTIKASARRCPDATEHASSGPVHQPRVEGRRSEATPGRKGNLGALARAERVLIRPVGADDSGAYSVFHPAVGAHFQFSIRTGTSVCSDASAVGPRDRPRCERRMRLHGSAYDVDRAAGEDGRSDDRDPTRPSWSLKVRSTEFFRPATISTDGSVKPPEKGDAGASGFVVLSLPLRKAVHAESFFKCLVTVNEVEYMGITHGLNQGHKEVVVASDSRVATQQIAGSLGCHKSNLEALLSRVLAVSGSFSSIKFMHVLQVYNQSAGLLTSDVLANKKGRMFSSERDLEAPTHINRLHDIVFERSGETATVAAANVTVPVEISNARAKRIRRIRVAQDEEPRWLKLKLFIREELPELTQEDRFQCSKEADLFELSSDGVLYYVGPLNRRRRVPITESGEACQGIARHGIPASAAENSPGPSSIGADRLDAAESRQVVLDQDASDHRSLPQSQDTPCDAGALQGARQGARVDDLADPDHDEVSSRRWCRRL